MAGNLYRDAEHPFAAYVRILGKGRKGSRSLAQDEAAAAMGMILRGEVLDVQLGAFLMLLRVKEETGEEIAGFVRAVRDATAAARAPLHADLDWASYAGKKNHLPWYLAAALLLAGGGVRVLMHGAGGHTLNRLYTEDALAALGLAPAGSLDEAARQLAQDNFSYLPLALLSPPLAAIIDLRNVLGLRSPVHTLARMLNPADAPCVFHGIFHPAYRVIHQQAGQLLGYRQLSVFKGEGGETERRPDAINAVLGLRNGEPYTLEWPALFNERHEKEGLLEPGVLRAAWRGERRHAYGEAAIVGTAAMALHAAGRADTPDDAMAMAQSLWESRDRRRL